jgi:hypothetical protein
MFDIVASARGEPRSPSRAGRAALLVVVTTAMLALTPALAAATPASTLNPGGTLSAGQELGSPDGHYDLLMQSDGNLVLYTAGGRALWSSKTGGQTGDQAVMQTDGNLVLYDASSQAIWSTNTSGADCAHLTLQDDGNLVLYGTSGAVWASNTVNSVLDPGETLTAGEEIVAYHEQYRLIMQGDGNLVLYNSAGKALWSTGTWGEPGNHVVMQGDGNLVVYSSGGRAMWNSKTEGNNGARLIVQDDGNLVIYRGSTPVWASKTVQAGIRQATARAASTTPPGNCGVPLPAPPPTPTPTPTPAPPPPVIVYVPVVVHVPTPRAPHHVKVRLTMTWTWSGGHTRLFEVGANRVPRRAAVTVTCRGRGCPAKARVASVHVRRLLKSLAGLSYSAGDRIFITIRAPGEVAERVELWIRFGRKPRVKLL